jgi:hypothetical protein
VHTYPEVHPDNGIATFRADIDVATCGLISPLKALNYLIETFESDIVIVDYRVRGFTREVRGEKHPRRPSRWSARPPRLMASWSPATREAATCVRDR